MTGGAGPTVISLTWNIYMPSDALDVMSKNTYTKPGMRSGIRPTLSDSMLATNPKCVESDASPVAGARGNNIPMGRMKGRILEGGK